MCFCFAFCFVTDILSCLGDIIVQIHNPRLMLLILRVICLLFWGVSVAFSNTECVPQFFPRAIFFVPSIRYFNSSRVFLCILCSLLLCVSISHFSPASSCFDQLRLATTFTVYICFTIFCNYIYITWSCRYLHFFWATLRPRDVATCLARIHVETRITLAGLVSGLSTFGGIYCTCLDWRCSLFPHRFQVDKNSSPQLSLTFFPSQGQTTTTGWLLRKLIK